jgi:TatD DNase family protein
MELIDTHTHLFLEEFNDDRLLIIKEAIDKKINKFFLPNIDSHSIEDILRLSSEYPGICYPLVGLHPTSVKENYLEELELVSKYLENKIFYGIGETGIDLYWDKTFLKQQEYTFKEQIELAKKYALPIIIHVRESFDEVFAIVDKMNDQNLTGIFHCFSGNYYQAQRIIEYGGFKLGIGGVVTFKNSGLAEIVSKIGMEHIVLETDSPYLAPVPYRGKRNKSIYLIEIANKIAEIKGISFEEVAIKTTENAKKVFKLK